MKGCDCLKRKLIIDENTIYELDEKCMLKERTPDLLSYASNEEREKENDKEIGENG